jgi:hypothetical protein
MYIKTYMYIIIHRSTICKNWTECGIRHEKSQIPIRNQAKSISHKITQNWEKREKSQRQDHKHTAVQSNYLH